MADELPLSEALDRGLAWLYTTNHPPGATVFHLGESLTCQHNRRLSFTPSSYTNGRPCVVLEVARPVRRRQARADELQYVPLTPRELDDLAALLTERGYTEDHRWNGFPATGGSIALMEPPHPSMQAALDRYRAGCPDHNGSVFCRCPARRAGFDLLVPLRPTPGKVAA